MNLERLEEGQIYKNYKELCEVLGEEVKTGNSKKAQLKEWQRHFEFEKQGQKIIINKIINIKELPKLENRGKQPDPIGELDCSGVYVLYDKFDSFYVGASANIKKRYNHHKTKQELSNSKLLDFDSMQIKIIEHTKDIIDMESLNHAKQFVINTMITNGCNVVNVKKAYCDKSINVDKKTIKVRKDDYQKVVKILLKNNINIY